MSLWNSLKMWYFMTVKEAGRNVWPFCFCVIFSLATWSSVCLNSLCFCWIKAYQVFFFESKTNWPNIFCYIMSYQISLAMTCHIERLLRNIKPFPQTFFGREIRVALPAALSSKRAVTKDNWLSIWKKSFLAF